MMEELDKWRAKQDSEREAKKKRQADSLKDVPWRQPVWHRKRSTPWYDWEAVPWRDPTARQLSGQSSGTEQGQSQGQNQAGQSMGQSMEQSQGQNQAGQRRQVGEIDVDDL